METKQKVLKNCCHLYEGKFLFQVCERHFTEGDILRETLHVDDATGSQVTVPLKHLRLRPGAVPSRFPNCPGYLSTDHSQAREAPESRRMRLDLRALETAVADSIETFASDQEEEKILSPKDLADYIRGKHCAFWQALESNGRLILVHIVESPAPWIKYSIVVNADLSLTLHVVKTATKRLGSNLCIPSEVKSKRAVMDLLDGNEKWDGAVSSKNNK